MLRDSIRGTLDRDAPIPRIRAWSEAEDLGQFTTLAARQGWYGIGVPEDAGGQGGGMIERAILHEELGRAAAPSGGLAAAAVALDLLSGEPGAASAMTELVAAGSLAVAVLSAGGQAFDRPVPRFSAEGSACR